MKALRKPATKSFDFGLYTFHRQVAGFICPQDDQKAQNGEIYAVLHPMTKVDCHGLFCFGVSAQDYYTKTLARKNLRFTGVHSLPLPEDSGQLELHAKLNAVVKYLRTRAGAQLPIPAIQVAVSP